MKKHVEVKNDTECYGCKNCENVCPVHAISMIENLEGFLYPKIDENRCINCGLCKKVCPYLNEIKNEKRLEKSQCYAMKAIDNNLRENSTSGGVFSLLAIEILKMNGIVYGSTINDEMKVKHIRIDDLNDLNKLKGSKYVYSDLTDIVKFIKKDLENSKQVLFSGVPCQIAAVKNYLNKEYENLYLVEVICHGTPNQKLFSKYINYLENKNKAKIKEFEFRTKKKVPWGTYKSRVVYIKNNGRLKEKKYNAEFDKYYNSFLKAENFRESCYKCKYATSKRNSDITLGDFWGIEQLNSKFADNIGISAVLINTQKGVDMINNIKKYIIYEKVTFAEMSKKNGNLISPSTRPLKRDKWYKNFDDKKFINKISVEFNVKKFLKCIIPSNIKNRIKKYLK